MTKQEFIKNYKDAMEKGYNYIGVAVSVDGNFDNPEYIINSSENFEKKLAYYTNVYDDNMRLKANTSIVISEIVAGNRFGLFS